MQLGVQKCDIFKYTLVVLIANLVAYQNPGIAAATSSRVDSAAKHIIACKVDSDLMYEFVSNSIQTASEKRRELHINKHKYCVFKNDLVLCTNKALFPSDNNRCTNRQNAYPAVVSTLADVEPGAKKFLSTYYGSQSPMFQMGLLTSFNLPSFATEFHDPNKVIKNLPYFSAQGYALGTAWASDQTGDTVSSVLIGGMQTVMNGAFACSAGEVLQWYFEFEEDLFYPKRVQLDPGEPHKEAASRKVTSEEDAAGKIYDKLKEWTLQNSTLGTTYNWHDKAEAGHALLMTLINAPARDKEQTIRSMQLDSKGDVIANQGFKIPGYDNEVFTLEHNGQNSTLTEFMQFGIVNRVSNFPVAIKNGNPVMESYNKGDTLRKRRREFNERMDGMGAEQKGNKAYPKPYRLYNGQDHYGDKIRIFAKCVSSARAHEMMDIMLMTQSL